MKPYENPPTDARYAEIERLAQLIWGPVWKTPLATLYEIRKQTVSDWKSGNPPAWVCIALNDRVKAMQLCDLGERLKILVS